MLCDRKKYLFSIERKNKFIRIKRKDSYRLRGKSNEFKTNFIIPVKDNFQIYWESQLDFQND